MSTRLVVVRHGETEWNLASRIQGHSAIGNDPGGQRNVGSNDQIGCSGMFSNIVISHIETESKDEIGHEIEEHAAHAQEEIR